MPDITSINGISDDGSTTPIVLREIKALALENEMTDTVVAMWDMVNESKESAHLESNNIHSPPFRNTGKELKEEENFIGKDPNVKRVQVSAEHFGPGGKYRAIVKLFMRYRGAGADEWSIGTGWLINKDLVVTAGHCGFDWDARSSTGREVVEVRAYIGYSGKLRLAEDIVSGQAEFRKGKSIAIPKQFITVIGSRQYDVSFIKLESPFKDVKTLSWENTPLKDDLTLGVVGYPGDLRLGDEMGAEMYEMYLKTDFNLNQSKFKMLEYYIDTYGGNSGGPVLTYDNAHSKLVSIGVHTYGGNPNSAVVIGPYGVPFADFIASYSLRDQAVSPSDPKSNLFPGLTLVSIPTNRGNGNINGQSPESLPKDGSGQETGSSKTTISGDIETELYLRAMAEKKLLEAREKMEEEAGRTESLATIPSSKENGSAEGESTESLKGILGTVGNVLGAIPKDILTVGGSLLGAKFGLGPSVGAALGSGAGMAIGAAGKFLAGLNKPESLGSESLYEGLAERAVMAEAALETVLRLGDDEHRPEIESQRDLQEKILQEMQTLIPPMVPFYKAAGTILTPVIKDHTLRTALRHIDKTESENIPVEQIPPPKKSAAEATESLSTESVKFRQGFESILTKKNGNESIPNNTEAFNLMGLISSGLNTIFGGESLSTKSMSTESTSLINKTAENAKAGKTESLADLLKTGLKIIAPVASTAIGLLGGNFESTATNPSTTATPLFESKLPSVTSFETAWVPALLGEAALQAIQKQKPEALMENGVYHFMTDIARRTGPNAMESAAYIQRAAPEAIAEFLASNRSSSGGNNAGKPDDGKETGKPKDSPETIAYRMMERRRLVGDEKPDLFNGVAH